MELTEFEVDSIYSRCLMELLQEGYVALFNYKGKNDSEIVLEKDGVAYLFCKQWDENVTYSIELQPIPETYQSTSLKYKEVPLLRKEREQAIKVLGVYYTVLSMNLKLLKHRGKATERMSQFAQQRMGGRLLMSTEKQLMSVRGQDGTI